MAYLKLMMDEKEIAHLSEDGQSLCANEGVPQYHLPLNLFIGDKRKVPLVDVVVWAKKRIFPKNRMDCKEILKLMGLPDYNAWEIVDINLYQLASTTKPTGWYQLALLAANANAF